MHKTNMLYLGAFFYNTSWNMTLILIPLYSFNQGFSVISTGIIVSIQPLINIFFRLFIGILIDKLGEKKLLLFSSATLIFACLSLTRSVTLQHLVIAQIMIGLSRSAFWPSIQSYASNLSEEYTPQLLGRTHSATQLGSVVGMAVAGYIAFFWNYPVSFYTASFIALLAFIVNMGLTKIRRYYNIKLNNIFHSIITLSKNHGLIMSSLLLFMSAIPIALTASLYPLYFLSIEIDEGLIGVLTSVRALGSAFMGMIFGLIINKYSQKFVLSLSLFAIGFCVALTILFDSYFVLLILMILLGFFSGSVNILGHTLAARSSTTEQRGAAMAFVSCAFMAAVAVIPIIFSAITHYIGLREAFIICGIMPCLSTLLIKNIGAYDLKTHIVRKIKN